jgi:hypothetical protein
MCDYGVVPANAHALSDQRPRSRAASPVRSEPAAKRQKRVTWADQETREGENDGRPDAPRGA